MHLFNDFKLQVIRREYPNIPSLTIDALARYVDHGLRPGSFLSAVINNDLREAIIRADQWNRPVIHDIVHLLFNHAPSRSWGYAGAVEDWVKIVHE